MAVSFKRNFDVDNFYYNGRFVMLRKVGAGSFGKVYAAYDRSKDIEVAIKFDIDEKVSEMLRREVKMYRQIGSHKNIPKIIYSGCIEETAVLVMELLGASLEELLMKCGAKFSLKTVLILADQMLSTIQYVHSRNIVHRDITAENFVMGINENAHKLYLVDFGLAKELKPGELCSIDFTKKVDVEKIGHTLIRFLKNEDIFFIPHISIQEMCEGLPQEFEMYMNYVYELNFYDDPDYTYLRYIFSQLQIKLGYVRDYVYDWSVLKH